MPDSTLAPIQLTKHDRLVFDGVGYIGGGGTHDFIQRFPIGNKANIGELPSPRPMPDVHQHGPRAMINYARDPYDFIVGTHEVCRGRFVLIRTSKSRQVIVCEHCHLRIEFPFTVTTYADLDSHLNPKQLCLF